MLLIPVSIHELAVSDVVPDLGYQFIFSEGLSWIYGLCDSGIMRAPDATVLVNNRRTTSERGVGWSVILEFGGFIMFEIDTSSSLCSFAWTMYETT